jgi:DNA-binding response OmpR family regulator
MSDDKKQLGRILLRQKHITQKDLDEALDEQKRGPLKPLASRLTEAGKITEVDALRALSEQLGVPGVDLSQVAILLEHLVIPREIVEAHKILPLLVKDDRIFLAMASPTDKKVIDEIEFVTGKKVYPYVALTGPLLKATQDAYDAKTQGETYYLGPKVTPETLARLGLSSRQASPAQPPSLHPPRAPSSPPEPPPVMDEATRRASADVEISTAELGNLSDDLSSITQLPDELRSRALAAAPSVGTGKLILVVDDEDEIRKLVKRLLTEKGHRVIEADRGLLALRLVKEHQPDLIILDAMLPELHGFDIARRIKGSAKYGHVPIIMISAVYRGWRIAEDLKSAYGIEDYLEKPFKLQALLAAVGRALTRDQRKHDDVHAMSADADQALHQGINAYKAGDLEVAIDHLRRGIGIDPLAYRLRYHLALLYGKKGLLYEAIQELEQAIELNPKHFPALKNLAVLYEKAGFRHKAVEMWERCVNVAPDADTKAQIKQHLMGLL